MRKFIPRTMATQHPDNAVIPKWSKWDIIQGDDEVYEAYYNYSRLDIKEVMWDSEGKDVDLHVTRKLLERFPDFFNKYRIGEDYYLTYRLPNPLIEGADRKVFMETIESITTACDVSKAFYGNEHPCPIFEVIIPMTTSYKLPVSVSLYYEKAVRNRQDIELINGLKVKDLVGPIYPEKIEVIPLIEDMESILNIRIIVGKTIEMLKVNYLRVFIARSDPAMNYGLIPAVLLTKIAISELFTLSNETGTNIYPIIGVGSLPFRGGLTPLSVEDTLREYSGFYTFTIQSAFRYDYGEDLVIQAVKKINESTPSKPKIIDKSDIEIILRIISKLVPEYQLRVEVLSGLINQIAELIPRRRARKLHVGLFGYPRSIGKIRLPRAIPFVGSMYSIGLPPEIIGISALDKLNEEEYSLLKELYVNLELDLAKAFHYYSPNSLQYITKIIELPSHVYRKIIMDYKYVEDKIKIKENEEFEEKKHTVLSELLLLCLKEKRIEEAKKYVEEMAILRKSIG